MDPRRAAGRGTATVTIAQAAAQRLRTIPKWIIIRVQIPLPNQPNAQERRNSEGPVRLNSGAASSAHEQVGIACPSSAAIGSAQEHRGTVRPNVEAARPAQEHGGIVEPSSAATSSSQEQTGKVRPSNAATISVLGQLDATEITTFKKPKNVKQRKQNKSKKAGAPVNKRGSGKKMSRRAEAAAILKAKKFNPATRNTATLSPAIYDKGRQVGCCEPAGNVDCVAPIAAEEKEAGDNELDYINLSPTQEERKQNKSKKAGAPVNKRGSGKKMSRRAEAAAILKAKKFKPATRNTATLSPAIYDKGRQVGCCEPAGNVDCVAPIAAEEKEAGDNELDYINLIPTQEERKQNKSKKAGAPVNKRGSGKKMSRRAEAAAILKAKKFKPATRNTATLSPAIYDKGRQVGCCEPAGNVDCVAPIAAEEKEAGDNELDYINLIPTQEERKQNKSKKAGAPVNKRGSGKKMSRRAEAAAILKAKKFKPATRNTATLSPAIYDKGRQVGCCEPAGNVDCVAPIAAEEKEAGDNELDYINLIPTQEERKQNKSKKAGAPVNKSGSGKKMSRRAEADAILKANELNPATRDTATLSTAIYDKGRQVGCCEPAGKVDCVAPIAAEEKAAGDNELDYINLSPTQQQFSIDILLSYFESEKKQQNRGNPKGPA